MGRGVPILRGSQELAPQDDAAVNTSLILFAEMAAFAATISRHLAAGVVIWPVFSSSVA